MDDGVNSVILKVATKSMRHLKLTATTIGRLVCLGLCLFWTAWPCPVFSAQPARSPLNGHLPPAWVRATPTGRLSANNSLTLAIGLPVRNKAALDQLLSQLYDTQSPNFHQFLTPQQFAATFGPTEQDYQAVINFAVSNNLTVVTTHSNHLVLDVEGKVSDIERAFGIVQRTYRHPTENRDFYAPDVQPSVPLNISVVDVEGLTDFQPPRPHSRPVATLLAHPLSGTGPSGYYMGNDFRNAYAPGAALTGAGQAVGLLEFSSYFGVDITNYENTIGLTNYVPLNNVLIGTKTPSTSANDEVALDIEVAIALAPKLSQVIVYEEKSVNPSSMLSRMANDNLAKQLSSSWTWGGGPSSTVDTIFQQMASQGQSFFQASGDSDAYTGSDPLDNVNTAVAPVDSPYLTAVGGVTLTMNGSGASWSSETVWNYNSLGGNQANVGSGGGISVSYSIPSWQTNVNMTVNQGSTTKRCVPDVALTGDAVYVAYGNGSSGGLAGTSCAAPLWAGFTALMNQQAVASGNTTVGFLNPALYAIANGTNYNACFHDTTTGDNIGTNASGLFPATSGYDLCTGLGTPTGTNLINALSPHPAVIVQPLTQTATNGNNVILSMAAGGQPPLTYQWRLNGTNVSGNTNNTLTLPSVTTSNAGSYSVVVSNNLGSITSSNAVLTVIFPPAFTTQPTNQTVIAGGGAVFGASVTGAAPLAFHWRQNNTNLIDGGNISGATTSTLTLTSTVATNAGSYTLFATNIYGAATSSVATLTVNLPPTITSPLATQTAQCGSNVTYSVTASGTPPLSYQWSLDGAVINGITATNLSIFNIHLPNRTVAVVVTNLYGSVTNAVTLTVQDTLPPAITLNGSNPLTIELGSTFADPGATASDLCSGTTAVVAGGSVNAGAVSTNIVTYTATDGNGNTNTATRTVLVHDTTPPVIAWSFTNLTLAAGTNCQATMPNVTGTNYILATDLSGALTIAQTPTNTASLPLGTNVVIITVADNSGNASHSTNTIIVLDQTPPSILTQPQNRTNIVGTSASFAITASACTPLAYQWFSNIATLTNQTNSTLSLSNLTSASAGNYFAIAVASGGSSTSTVASLTIVFPPSFSAQPTNQTVTAGNSAIFSATAGGTSPLFYQWRVNGTNLANSGNTSGATSDSLTLSSVAPTNVGAYTLVVTNAYGAATSSVATLTVNLPPTITVPPAGQTLQCGGNVAFSVTATGTPPLSYQWKLDGAPVNNATNTSLLLTNVHLPDHAATIVVSSPYGSATNSVPLTVQDTLAPVITLNGANPLTIELGGTFTDPGASASDLCAGPVSATVNGTVNNNAVGTNIVTYTATDGNGNTNTATRAILVHDTTPPVIAWSFTNLTIAAGTNCTALMPDVTGTNYILATDLSGSLAISQTPTNNASLPLGTNTVIITVADNSGNLSHSTNQIIVQDQTPPTILTQPQSQTNTAGTSASFNVTASACTPLTCQWFFNSITLTNQTNSALSLSNLTSAAAGNYFAVATASGGAATSSVVTLTVNLLVSSVALTSSENPSGLNDSINFTAAVTPTNAGGTVQFLTNGVVFDTESLVAGQAVSASLAVLPLGTNFITALYSGDASDQPSSNTLSQITTFVDPVPQFVHVVGNPDGSVTFNLFGAPGHAYILEATPDLLLPDGWQPVATNVLGTNGAWQFTDQQVTNFSQRFFRLRLGP